MQKQLKTSNSYKKWRYSITISANFCRWI